jgi:hypothetical protein
MDLRSVITLGLCAGAAVWAQAPSPVTGPTAAAEGLIVPRFRIEEAARKMADDALSQRDVPGAVVIVIAVDDRKRALDIATSVKRQFEPQTFCLKHFVGNQRLFAFMKNPKAMDISGLGMHNYGCFLPSAAPPP